MDTIKDIIKRIMGPMAQDSGSAAGVARAWAQLNAQGTAVADFKDGCLTVHVDCAARLVKMNLHKGDYLGRLNKQSPGIKDIRFKVGRII